MVFGMKKATNNKKKEVFGIVIFIMALLFLWVYAEHKFDYSCIFRSQ